MGITREFLQAPIVIILTITNVTQEDVIDYCGTWFRSNRKALAAMFMDPNIF
jgi:fumarate reductase subunit C